VVQTRGYMPDSEAPNPIEDYIMTKTYKQLSAMANKIVQAYKEGKLGVTYFSPEKTKFLPSVQVRTNKVNIDTVPEIVAKMRRSKSAKFVDPILVAVGLAKSIIKKLSDDSSQEIDDLIVNGNHTRASLLEAIKRKLVPGLTEIPIAVIPEDMLPEDEDDIVEVLKLVAISMNKVEKIVQGMSKSDVHHTILMDLIDGKEVKKLDYQEALADAADLTVKEIATLVAKAIEHNTNVKLNKKFNFKQYSVAEMNDAKATRQYSLGDDTEVTWAVVTTDKTYETLGKAIGNAVENHAGKAHIIFHFKNYEDVSRLQKRTVKKIEKFTDLCEMEISYEFLPWIDPKSKGADECSSM